MLREQFLPGLKERPLHRRVEGAVLTGAEGAAPAQDVLRGQFLPGLEERPLHRTC